MSSSMAGSEGFLDVLLGSLTPILKSLLSTGLTLGAAVGIISWEQCLRLPDEVRYIFWPDVRRLVRKRQLPSMPSILLFAARVLGLMSVCTSIASPSAEGQKECATLLYVHGSIGVVLTLISTLIFVVRTMAVSPGKHWLHAFLLLNAFGVTAFCAVVTSHLRPTPQFPGVESCSGVYNDFHLGWLLYVWQIFFDLVVAVTTLHCIGNLEWSRPHRLPANIKARVAVMSGVNREFFFGAMTWALVSCAINTTQAAYVKSQIDAGNFTLTTVLIPLNIVQESVIAPRMISSLKLHQAKKGFSSLESAARGSRHSEKGRRSHDGGAEFQLGNGRFLTKAFDNLESGQGSPDSVIKALESGDSGGDTTLSTALHAAPVLTRLAPAPASRHDELESVTVVGAPREMQEARSSFARDDGNVLGLARPPAAVPQSGDTRQTLTRGVSGRSDAGASDKAA